MKTAKKNVEALHKSVLMAETLELASSGNDQLLVDATLGLGGHSEAILKANSNTRVVGIDQDTDAIKFAKKRLEKFDDRIKFVHSNFAEIKQVLKSLQVQQIDGVIADLGVSSLQLDDGGRGFSFRTDAPLDMRMDPNSELETAAGLLERLDEEEIANIIYNYGEERFSRRIARRIVAARENGEPVKTTFELAELARRSVKRSKKDKIHPATRTFQALRIAVNKEIEILEEFLRDSVDLLKTDGKLVVISFHSIEDRVVKRAFLNMAGRCSCPPKFPKCICGASEKVKILTRKPVIPGETEQNNNPRSRSAKLRACQKVGI